MSCGSFQLTVSNNCGRTEGGHGEDSLLSGPVSGLAVCNLGGKNAERCARAPGREVQTVLMGRTGRGNSLRLSSRKGLHVQRGEGLLRLL